jgi:hypothetical protein
MVNNHREMQERHDGILAGLEHSKQKGLFWKRARSSNGGERRWATNSSERKLRPIINAEHDVNIGGDVVVETK